MAGVLLHLTLMGLRRRRDEDEGIASITFTGKKKKSSKSSKKSSVNSLSAALLDEETNDNASVSKLTDEAAGDDASILDEDTTVVTFSGKKKSSKKKSNNAFTATDAEPGDDTSEVVESDLPSVSASTKLITEDVAENSKNKKKKKKSGRTAQEEEDLDKILAELGEAPPASKPSPTPAPVPVEPNREENIQSQLEPDDVAGQLYISSYWKLCSCDARMNFMNSLYA